MNSAHKLLQFRSGAFAEIEMLRLLFTRSRHLSSSLRPFSTLVETLVNSHGFSPSAAATASSRIPPKAAQNVDSVLSLLKDYSFTPADTTAFLTRYPAFASVVKPQTLKPKLEFLSRFGMSGENLINLLCNDANVLSRSLEFQFIPAVHFLVGFLGSKSAVVSLFASKCGRGVLRNCSESTELNVGTLMAFDVPRSSIQQMLSLRTGPLAIKPGNFRDIVSELTRFGLNPRSKNFIYGVTVVAGMKRVKLDTHVALLKQFGFSDDQAKALFVKQPMLMGHSTNRIERGLKLFLGEWGWKIQSLLDRPMLLMSSIEKKIIPRKSIFLLLLSKNCVKESDEVSMLVIAENLFLRRYLMRHMKEVPEILEMYKSSKLQMVDGGVKSGDVRIAEVNEKNRPFKRGIYACQLQN